MQTVIFTCRQCGKEMAAAEELLGLEVRCPHCQQVVQAPAATPAAVPVIQAAPTGSIFDDSPPPAVDEPMTWQAPGTTTMFLTSEQDAGVAPTSCIEPTETIEPTTETEGGTLAELPRGAATQPRSPEPTVRRESLLAFYLLVVLVPYSILMTALALWFYYHSHNVVDPMELLPDWPRDNEPPARQGGTFQRLDDAAPLPRRLRVGLGQTLHLGDLEITPQQVRQQRVLFSSENAPHREIRSEREALALTLQVRNRSATATFAPNDLFFNRRWREGSARSQRPYTCLEVGSQRFYGGPCNWRPRQVRPKEPREFVAGSLYNQYLEPGAGLTYLICTDPDNAEVLTAVARTTESLLWRVQIRRGLVRIRDRDTTATAVVGIEFASQDIQRN
jgi:phage FluMu protein Com